ncbi:MAG TPA: M28 family metallopeptidase [Conexibacter sp.]|nr:M28 family metallopeptidase [Conexibacter sp.]
MSTGLRDPRSAIDADAIGARIDAICAIGNRFVGTPGERRARTHVHEQLERAGGLDVRLETVDTLAYVGGSATCRLGDDGETLAAVGLQGTAGGGAHGEALYLGGPTSPEQIAARVPGPHALAGRIAVLHSEWPWAVAPWLAEQGVAGIVVISQAPVGVVPNHVAKPYPAARHPVADDGPLPVPGVLVEASAGHRLLAALCAGALRLTLAHDARYVQEATANVVAELPGAGDELLVVGAHYDTQREGVGAHDNATGLAALLEIARAWSGRRLRRSVRFVAFCDEESTLRGAEGYCRRHADELDATVAMINLDALAWAHPGVRALLADDSIADYAVARATEIGWAPERVDEASALPAGDLVPFLDAGVPACWFWRFPPQHPYYHSAEDVPELVDVRAVAEVAGVVAHVGLSIADSDVRFGRSRPRTRWKDLRPAERATA